MVDLERHYELISSPNGRKTVGFRERQRIFLLHGCFPKKQAQLLADEFKRSTGIDIKLGEPFDRNLAKAGELKTMAASAARLCGLYSSSDKFDMLENTRRFRQS